MHADEAVATSGMGDTAVVDGIGGVGILVVQAAAHAGGARDRDRRLRGEARSREGARRERRGARATRRGLRDGRRSGSGRCTDGRGTDVFFELVGTTQTMNAGHPVPRQGRAGSCRPATPTSRSRSTRSSSSCPETVVRLHGRRDAARPAGRAHARGGGRADGARSRGRYPARRASTTRWTPCVETRRASGRQVLELTES